MEVALISAVMALILLFHDDTKEMVVVLPDAAGRTGMVVVERGNERVILNEPYATSTITRDGHIRLEKLTDREVQRAAPARPLAEGAAPAKQTVAVPSPFERAVAVMPSFELTVAALPARPISFSLYFVTGTDTLTDPSKLEFERMLAELRRREAADIVVIGHTDRVGNEEANDELSLQRAERVKADLVAQGIAPVERIRAAGRGERDPVVPTENGVDEPLNRRVEINVR